MLPGLLLFALGSPPSLEAVEAPHVPESRAEAASHFGAGLWQARRNRLLSSIQSLEAAAKRDPDSTAALKELIAVYSQIGREREAIRAARTVLEKDPRDASTAQTLARLLVDTGELAEAAAFAQAAADTIDAAKMPEKALTIFRDLAAIEDRRGQFAASAGAWQRAIGLLQTQREAFAKDDADAETAAAYERLGKALTKAGKSAAAADAFRVAAKLFADPKGANDRSAAARLEWNLAVAESADSPAAALAHLQSFLQRQPRAVEPYERLVALLVRTGRSGEIVPTLQRLATPQPKNAPLQAVLAVELARSPGGLPASDLAFSRLLAATNDPKIVRLAVRSAIDSNRTNKLLIDLDGAYRIVKDEAKTPAAREFAAEKARTLLNVLRDEPTWAPALIRAAAADLRGSVSHEYQTLHAVGLLAARVGQLGAAEDQLRQSLRTAPPAAQGEIIMRIIRVQLLGHKPAEVAATCREALNRNQLLALFPLYAAYFHKHMAVALARLGKADEAVAAVDRAIAEAGDADRLGFRLSRVRVLGLVNRTDEAVAACKKLLDEFHDQADRVQIRYESSGIYTAAKKHAEAEAELRAILDIDPDYKWACNDLGYHLADGSRSLPEAERLIRRAIAVDRADRHKSGDMEPVSGLLLDSLAWLLFRQDKLTEARDLLEQVSRMAEGGSDGVVWDHLGDVRYRLGEKDKARAAWQEAARLLAGDNRDGRRDEVKRKLRRLP
ncbi:MAG TPA: tetratricopeptide repeat protein [Urbifossiella sp.]|nr:tetratricopeptide repeat protein [Urbifossiella sp.]